MLLGAALLAACGGGGEGPPSSSTTAEEEELDLARRYDADQALPLPSALPERSYREPRGRMGWIERLASKLGGGRSQEALDFALESLAQIGPDADAFLARQLADERGRSGQFARVFNTIRCLAMGGRRSALQPLLGALAHRTPMIRLEALRGLEEIRAPQAFEPLREVLLRYGRNRARRRLLSGAGPYWRCIDSLRDLPLGGGLASACALAAKDQLGLRLARDGISDEEAQRIVGILAVTPHPEVAALFDRMLRDNSYQRLHRDLVESAALLDDHQRVKSMLRFVVDAPARSDEPLVKPWARRALAILGDEVEIQRFLAMADSAEQRERVLALQALGMAGRDDALLAHAADPEPAVRVAAIKALGIACRRLAGCYPPDVWPPEPLAIEVRASWIAALERALADRDQPVRLAAARVAALLGRQDLLAPICRQLASPDPAVLRAAFEIVTHPEVRAAGAAGVLVELLGTAPAAERRRLFQAACLLADARYYKRLAAYLDSEERWGELSAGEIAAIHLGDLGRAIVPLLIARYRAGADRRERDRIARVIMAALVRRSEGRVLEPPRWTQVIAPGARFLLEEALADLELTGATRHQILVKAPLYGGTAVLPLLLARLQSPRIGPRERGWLQITLGAYF